MRTYILHLAGGGVINLHGGPVNEEVAEQPKPACETCRFWFERQGDEGCCRRYPPTFTGYEDDENHGSSAYPPAWAVDWCGEYERAAK